MYNVGLYSTRYIGEIFAGGGRNSEKGHQHWLSRPKALRFLHSIVVVDVVRIGVCWTTNSAQPHTSYLLMWAKRSFRGGYRVRVWGVNVANWSANFEYYTFRMKHIQLPFYVLHILCTGDEDCHWNAKWPAMRWSFQPLYKTWGGDVGKLDGYSTPKWRYNQISYSLVLLPNQSFQLKHILLCACTKHKTDGVWSIWNFLRHTYSIRMQNSLSQKFHFLIPNK